MTHPILGLHHVTATVDDAQADLDFCLDLLGMRLVKKTVNFDNHDVYHFYYGTERGVPGTIWTTFPYKDRGVRVGVKGRGPGGDDVVFGAGRVARLLAQPAERTAAWRPGTSRPASAKRPSASTIRPVCGSSWSRAIAIRGRRGRATASARARRFEGCTA